MQGYPQGLAQEQKAMSTGRVRTRTALSVGMPNKNRVTTPSDNSYLSNLVWLICWLIISLDITK